MTASAKQRLHSALEQLQATDDLLSAAVQVKAMGHVLGLSHPAVVDDYTRRRLLTAENGCALAEIFGWEPEIQAEWVEYSLSRICPVGAVCRVTTRPFTWNAATMAELAREIAGRSGQRWNLTPERGIVGGISVPIHLPRCSVGTVGWVSRDPALDLDAILTRHGLALRMAALHIMDIIYAGREDEGETLPTILSQREIECLTWVALGRTDAEVAELIHRSTTTARFHVENAISKLGARNRAQAVAIACQRGLIQPACDDHHAASEGT